MKLSQLHCELLLTWFRENATPEQRVKLQTELPLAYIALVEDLVQVQGGLSANINAAPIKRPSARRIRT
jgi:hypothetical protein